MESGSLMPSEADSKVDLQHSAVIMVLKQRNVRDSRLFGKNTKQLSGMELYSEADKTIWEEKYMPVSLKKGQKVSLTKGNPGLKNVVVGIGYQCF